MGSINKSHNEADGGILLFNGELILLYCDSVQCEIGGKESVKGRVYLTTHRLVMIVTPYKSGLSVKSLCAPFCAITKCNVEQPIFGANYIEATVRDESDLNRSFSFKLKFSKGGAIELAMAMNRAVAAVGRNFNPSMAPPPAYTPSPSAQYYQAPPTVYAPGYNSGVQMPLGQFPDAPPIGFIYASNAPPPYPGLGGAGGIGAGQQQQQQPPPYSQGPAQGYPAQANPGYPQASNPGYPQASNPGYPQASNPGYPQASNPGYPAPSNPGYPQASPGGYPQAGQGQQQASAAGFAYPGQQGPAAAYPGYAAQQQPAAGGQPAPGAYPELSAASGAGNQQAAPASWPSAPSFNPEWKEEKK